MVGCGCWFGVEVVRSHSKVFGRGGSGGGGVGEAEQRERREQRRDREPNLHSYQHTTMHTTVFNHPRKQLQQAYQRQSIAKEVTAKLHFFPLYTCNTCNTLGCINISTRTTLQLQVLRVQESAASSISVAATRCPRLGCRHS